MEISLKVSKLMQRVFTHTVKDFIDVYLFLFIVYSYE